MTLSLQRKGQRMTLSEEISRERKKVHTNSYPMSIGELANLYKDDELYIYPEFQRIFRWTNEQRSRLIESILLGIPLPPIFVSQRHDGVWDVVDGVQRLSTIFQYMGILKGPLGDHVAPIPLIGTPFLPSLQDKQWDDATTEGQEVRLAIKRTKMDINIVMKESDERTKYELFMRLNTAGTPLSPQEVRNCLMIMAYPDLYKWINGLSLHPNFVESIALSENAIDEKYSMELVLRFATLIDIDPMCLATVGDIGEFLNESLSGLHDRFQNPAWRRSIENAFVATFDILNAALEANAFRRYNSGRYKGGFSIAAYEVVGIGCGYAILNSLPSPDRRCVDISQSIWTDVEFLDNSGSGVRASTRISTTIPYGRKLYAL
jgi:hypothetical protein